MDLRRNHICHTKFNPELNSSHFKNLYSPNMETRDKNIQNSYIYDHCRELGNLEQEPINRQAKNYFKVFGDLVLKDNGKKLVTKFDPDGKIMSKAEVQL